ncbi:MAG: histidine phosphatase family protein, partial [Rhodospirillaceae bacterium]
APDLREQDFGEWDGQSWAALAGADQAEDAALKAFWRAPGRTRPPGGESFAAMIDRVGESLRALSFRLDGQTEHDDVLAVVHAGTVRAALAVALALDPDAALRVMVAPLSLTRIDWLGPADTGGDPAWRVVGVNRVPP